MLWIKISDLLRTCAGIKMDQVIASNAGYYFYTVEPLLWGYPFLPEMWPLKRGGLPSGVEIIKINISSGLSSRDGFSLG